MMNKNRSAKLHLLRFLFLVPVLAFILVSFRKDIGDTLAGKQKQLQVMPASTSDTIPDVTERNNKGYIINVKDKKGECLLVIKDKTGKEVKRMLLTEWNDNAEKYEALYGEIPPPPPPALPKALPDPAKEIDANAEYVEIRMKDGEVKKYNLLDPKEKDAFVKKYPNIPLPPPASPASPFEVPVPPAVFNYPAAPTAPTPVKLPASVQNINISNKKAAVTLKNGQKENYDLNNEEQKAKFDIKYGEFVAPPPPPPAKEMTEKPIRVSVIEERIDKSNIQNRIVFEERPVTKSSQIIQGNPLVVVDGEIASKAALDNINPERIASIDVLKGNAAVALYGDKGKEGVIIIKTKKQVEAKPVTANTIKEEVVVMGKPISKKSESETPIEVLEVRKTGSKQQ